VGQGESLFGVKNEEKRETPDYIVGAFLGGVQAEPTGVRLSATPPVGHRVGLWRVESPKKEERYHLCKKAPLVGTVSMRIIFTEASGKREAHALLAYYRSLLLAQADINRN
jgi:hypothetical protein